MRIKQIERLTAKLTRAHWGPLIGEVGTLERQLVMAECLTHRRVQFHVAADRRQVLLIEEASTHVGRDQGPVEPCLGMYRIPAKARW